VEPTIVVPLIGSVESVDALQSARAVARITGGHLVLLGAMPRRHPHVSRTDEVHTRRELESLARMLRKEGIAAEAQLRRAEPGEAIVDAVREFDASAIVRPSDDGHDLAGWLRRTIVDEVMHQIQTPVLIVPAGEVPPLVAASRLRVLVPLDGSALAESALVHMLGIARRRKLEIRLIDVIHQRLGPLGALPPSLPDPKTERRATARYLEDVAVSLRAAGVVTHTDVIESQDPASQVLLDLARQSSIDVIAIATRSRAPRAYDLQERAASEVLEQGPFPVLLVPSRSGLTAAGQPARGGQPTSADVIPRQRSGGATILPEAEEGAVPAHIAG
jgi:nucleotide-binding universal stress UspA family protein